jgi:hypothetical protein
MLRSPLATTLMLAILVVAIGCDDSKSSSSDVWPPDIGSQYVVGKHKDVICSSDDAALNRAFDAAAKNDEEGFEQALAGTLAGVAPGTTVRILNYDMFKGVADMRIRTGSMAGERVYCEVGAENHGFFVKKVSDE